MPDQLNLVPGHEASGAVITDLQALLEERGDAKTSFEFSDQFGIAWQVTVSKDTTFNTWDIIVHRGFEVETGMGFNVKLALEIGTFITCDELKSDEPEDLNGIIDLRLSIDSHLAGRFDDGWHDGRFTDEDIEQYFKDMRFGIDGIQFANGRLDQDNSTLLQWARYLREILSSEQARGAVEIPEGYIAETIVRLVKHLEQSTPEQIRHHTVEPTPRGIKEITAIAEPTSDSTAGLTIELVSTPIPMLSVEDGAVGMRLVYDWVFMKDGSVKGELYQGLAIDEKTDEGDYHHTKELWVFEDKYSSEAEIPEEQKRLIERALSGVNLAGIVSELPEPITWNALK